MAILSYPVPSQNIAMKITHVLREGVGTFPSAFVFFQLDPLCLGIKVTDRNPAVKSLLPAEATRDHGMWRGWGHLSFLCLLAHKQI